MAYYDRHYYGDDQRGYGGGPGMGSGIGNRLSLWSVTTWLIILNVAVFVLDGLLARFAFGGGYALQHYGEFSISQGVHDLEIWRFLTFQFLHSRAGLMHLVFNMLGLFFFGPMIENLLTSRRFLVFYLVCGVAGPLAYIALFYAGVLISRPDIGLIGASAGVFGILIGAARFAPQAQVLFMFIFPMSLRTLAWILVGFNGYYVIANEANAGGSAAHLGGAAMGFFLVGNRHWLGIADRLPTFRRGMVDDYVAKRRAKAEQREFENREALRKEVDRILAKVHEHGLHSLTNKEKKMLSQETEMQRKGK